MNTATKFDLCVIGGCGLLGVGLGLGTATAIGGVGVAALGGAFALPLAAVGGGLGIVAGGLLVFGRGLNQVLESSRLELETTAE